jgi:hypothetical protein
MERIVRESGLDGVDYGLSQDESEYVVNRLTEML